jgi:GT2 family glycosyltransferase
MIPFFQFEEPRYPLSVVVLSHNRLDELTRNIPDLIHDCERLGYELIVADNASNEETRDFLKKVTAGRSEVTVLYHSKNLGVAGGRNSTFAASHGEFILSIDDDTRVSHDFLCEIPGLMRNKYSDVGILAVRVKHLETGEDQNPAGDFDVPVRNHHGSACVLRREAIAKAGGMDEHCDFGLDELDLCIRVHAAGYRILYTPSLVAYHNSFYRLGEIGFWRRKQWIFNSARTLYQYFPFPMAFIQSTRYFVWAVRGDLLRAKFLTLFRLFAAHLHGCWVGVIHHRRVPAATAAYYADPDLLPENGNKPCLRAAIKRWMGKRLDRIRGVR